MAIVVCLGTLFFFKYFDFLLGSVIGFLNLFSLDLKGFALNLILPIGISFYTFQTLSYVIDVYKGKFQAEHHLGYYMLFVAFFPQLVAGPIERPGDLLPQLRAEHKFDKEDFAVGFRIMLVGFFFKCVLADFFGIFVNNVYENAENASALAVLISTFLFMGQMYCDFAGYAEIATGVARMMGIRLTRNFDRPYLATSFTDYFHRWHITLTRWFTDYVYIPLGGNRKGKFRKILNVFIVFLLCGLWHGANWTYVIWGSYIGVMLTLENLFGKKVETFFTKRGVDFEGDSAKAVRRVIMFLLIIPSAIFFRASSVSEAGVLFSKLFTGWSVGFEETMNLIGLNVLSILQIALCLICLFRVYYFGEYGREKTLPNLLDKTEETYKIQRLSSAVYIIFIIALCWLAIVGREDASAFLYFQF